LNFYEGPIPVSEFVNVLREGSSARRWNSRGSSLYYCDLGALGRRKRHEVDKSGVDGIYLAFDYMCSRFFLFPFTPSPPP
jgi:hypothetical protein